MAGEWEDVALEDVADEITVGYVGSMASEYVEGGVPFLRSQNIEPLRINKNDLKYITPQFHQRIRKSRLSPGDVVIVRTGKPGSCSVVPPWFSDGNCSDLVIVRCGERINNHFLAYYVNTAATHHVSSHTVGAVQQHFNVGAARTLRINLPPLSVQKRIVHVLGTLDDKIELNRRMNATLEAMAQTLFKSWFVDFDPTRRNSEGQNPRPEDSLFSDSFEESAIGEIPAGWDVMSLYDTATYRNGAPFKPADFCPNRDGLPVVKIAELKSGLSEQTKWSKKQLGSDQMIDTGDLLYSWSGSPDTSLDAFLWSNGPGLVNQHIFKVITSSDAEKRFVYYLLKHLRPILVETARDKQTTGLGHVTVADMKRLQVCRPQKDVLTAFDRLIAPIFDKAFSNTVENQTLATLRDTLLPRLLSGELTVRELEFVSA